MPPIPAGNYLVLPYGKVHNAARTWAVGEGVVRVVVRSGGGAALGVIRVPAVDQTYACHVFEEEARSVLRREGNIRDLCPGGCDSGDDAV